MRGYLGVAGLAAALLVEASRPLRPAAVGGMIVHPEPARRTSASSAAALPGSRECKRRLRQLDAVALRAAAKAPVGAR